MQCSEEVTHVDDVGVLDPRSNVISDEGSKPMVEVLAEHDIVVNCVLQDPDAPYMFVSNHDLDVFAPGSLIIDVSCDEGMGFEWARPTTFSVPMSTVGDGVHYYAVDHSRSYLWNSATWEISEALLSYLPTVMAGPEAWDKDEAIRRAIEIHNGVIQNPKILSFQNRSPEYPPAPSPKSVGQPVVGDRLVVLAGHDVIDDLGRIAQRVVHRALLDGATEGV